MADQSLPDDAAIQIAYSKLRTTMPLTEIMQHKTLSKVVIAIAKKNEKRRRAMFDYKKLQSNDYE